MSAFGVTGCIIFVLVSGRTDLLASVQADPFLEFHELDQPVVNKSSLGLAYMSFQPDVSLVKEPAVFLIISLL